MIYLQKHFLDIPSYVQTFKPKDDGEVDIKTLCKIWSCDQEKALETIKNHPDFYVNEPLNDGDKNSQKDGGKGDK